MCNHYKTILAGAMALATVFTACQREAMIEDPVSPNYNPTTNEVVADFVFNVSTNASQTKQASTAVQAGSTDPFRGITNATLLAYALNDGTDPTNGLILAADADAAKIFDLATVSAPGTLSSTNSRRVLELSLPVKTNTLLFYGIAPKGDAYSGYTNLNDCYGHMDAFSIGKIEGSANIQIGSRVSDAEYAKFTTIENLMAGIQTTLINHKLSSGTTITAASTPGTGNAPYGFNVTLESDISWFDYTAANGKSPYDTEHERYPLEDKLYNLYKEITVIRTADGELRAGSGEAVIRMAKDLLSVLMEIRRAEPTCEAEAVAKYFANAVYNRMTSNYFEIEVSEGSISAIGFKDQATILAAYASATETAFRPATTPADFAWPTVEQLSAVSEYNPTNFPFNFNLPRGSSYLAFDTTTKCFYYPQSFNVTGFGGSATSTFNAKSYFYPAELMYFGNSPIRTSTTDKKATEYPNLAGTGTNGWEADASWNADWTKDGVVSSSTRAVAMSNDIQYGTAMLETKVQFASGILKLKDNNHAVQEYKLGGVTLPASEEPDNEITITNTMFKLTGLLIGGQYKKVGWDYLPLLGDGNPQGFVYDKAIPTDSQTVPTPTGKQNYTLVLDNFKAASISSGIYTPAAAQDKVYVALEFLNNTGVDFFGNANLIPKGGYFYIIGCLDPAAAGLTAITWPTDRPVPPYTAAGASQEVTRVFIQDFLTKATFTIGENSLKSAYLTVPDLRSSSMSLGLSVDLKWESGLDFGEVILGQ